MFRPNELDFETDLNGNRVIFISGGLDDIWQAHLSAMEEEVIVKIVKNMTFEDVLQETRIQTYLITSTCAPKLRGPEKPEIMIVQQMCAKGKQVSLIYNNCHLLCHLLVILKKIFLQTMSSLIRVHTVCLYAKIGLKSLQEYMYSTDEINRRHFQMQVYLVF